MAMEQRLSEKWIKASIAGTLWAASEIVLGSFLHNLRIPFGGNLLTAIGIIILISISYVWSEKGLFWRAGLICALLKTLSPSAVIFGPMIAIFSEALLLELSVLIFGKTIPGYLVGSMMAMSWNLFQKIANFLIIYGANIALVYSNLLKMAQKQLNIQTDIVWLPIIALLIVFALFGLLAGIIGINVGKRLQEEPGSGTPGTTRETGPVLKHGQRQPFSYSVRWLLLNVSLLILSFILLDKTPWLYWSAAITGIIILWSFRYKRALRRLMKPGFWLFFILITLATAFVFSKIQSGSNPLRDGLLTGIQMNFRAAVIVMGFTVIGTELYNPVIRNFFSGTAFKNLPLALELSAESLPAFIANIPDFRSLVKNPVNVLHQVISQAEKRLDEIKGNSFHKARVFIVTGEVGGGKTGFIENLVKTLERNKVPVGGIISRKINDSKGKTGYDIVNILTGYQIPFLRQGPGSGEDRVGRFIILKDGLEEGRKILDSLALPPDGFVVIDEVGFLELNDDGWAENLNKLLDSSHNRIILAVRLSLLDKVKIKWNLVDAVTLNVGEIDFVTVAENIISETSDNPTA